LVAIKRSPHGSGVCGTHVVSVFRQPENAVPTKFKKCRLLSKLLNSLKSSLHSKHGSDFQIRRLGQSRLKKSFGLPPEISSFMQNPPQ